MVLQLTDEQAEKLNRALAGEKLDLTDEEAGLLNEAMGAKIESPKPSQTESAVRGGIQGATLGWSDEAEAAAKAATSGTPIPLSPEASLLAKFKESYARKLPEVRQEYKAAEEANPWTYKGAQLAGNLPYAATPGGIPSMMAAGAIQSVGEAETSDLGELGVEAVKGATWGSLPGLGGKGLQSLKGTLKATKELQAARALGPTKGTFGKTVGTIERKAGILGEAADRGVVTPLANTGEMLERVKTIKDSAVGAYDDVAKELASEGMVIDGKALTQNIKSDVMSVYDDPDIIKVTKKALKDVETRANSPEGLKALKNTFAQKGYKDGKPVLTEKGALYRDLSKTIEDQYSKAIEFSADMSKNPEILKKYAQAKKDYAFAKEAERSLANKLAGELGNAQLGMIDTGTIVSGVMSGNVPAAAAIVAGRKLFKAYGNQLTSSAAKTLENALNTGNFTTESLAILSKLGALQGAGGED